MSKISRLQSGTKWLEQNGALSPMALRLLNDIIARVGGESANTNAELSTAVITAQSTATAAQATATAAQADIDATQALQFIVGASEALLPNARVLTAGIGTSIDTGTAGQAKVNILYWPITTFREGIPAGSTIVYRVRVARPMSLPANLTGSYGDASANFTAEKSYDLQKNGVSFGTADFALGASTATFSTSATSFSAGDLLTIVAPAVADATGADVGFSLLASLT